MHDIVTKRLIIVAPLFFNHRGHGDYTENTEERIVILKILRVFVPSCEKKWNKN